MQATGTCRGPQGPFVHAELSRELIERQASVDTQNRPVMDT
jgi:hypothetical protein